MEVRKSWIPFLHVLLYFLMVVQKGGEVTSCPLNYSMSFKNTISKRINILTSWPFLDIKDFCLLITIYITPSGEMLVYNKDKQV